MIAWGRLALLGLLLSCVATASSAPQRTERPTKVYPGGRVLGVPTKLVCLATTSAEWIDLDFPARGGCAGKLPTRVRYLYVDGANHTVPGGGTLLFPRDALDPQKDTRVRFAVHRRLPGGGPADHPLAELDVVAEGYGLEVTVGADCQDGGDTRGTSTCWFTRQ